MPSFGTIKHENSYLFLLPSADALYETLRVACNSYRVRGLALSEAMPLAFTLASLKEKPLVRVSVSEREEKALRCAILPSAFY